MASTLVGAAAAPVAAVEAADPGHEDWLDDESYWPEYCEYCEAYDLGYEHGWLEGHRLYAEVREGFINQSYFP